MLLYADTFLWLTPSLILLERASVFFYQIKETFLRLYRDY